MPIHDEINVCNGKHGGPSLEQRPYSLLDATRTIGGNTTATKENPIETMVLVQGCTKEEHGEMDGPADAETGGDVHVTLFPSGRKTRT